MGQQADPRKTPKTSVHDHASHPLHGSGVEEEKSYAPGTPDGADTEIAADDAGASAMAERAEKRSEGLENDG